MENNEESLISHLEALRSIVIKCFIAMGIGIIPMFFLAPHCIDLLIKLITKKTNITLNFFSPMEVFILQVKTSALLDFVICFPYIIKNIWRFIVPALYDNEKKFLKTIILTSSLLFVSGVVFCLYLVIPLFIEIGLSFANKDLQPLFGISNIISTSLWLSVCFGLMFQFPILTYFLIYFNIVGYTTMKSKRPYVFVLILIMSAVLTPTPDIINQLLLALPTYLLFEIGLFCSRKNKLP